VAQDSLRSVCSSPQVVLHKGVVAGHAAVPQASAGSVSEQGSSGNKSSVVVMLQQSW